MHDAPQAPRTEMAVVTYTVDALECGGKGPESSGRSVCPIRCYRGDTE
jgi:hypothetical protein